MRQLLKHLWIFLLWNVLVSLALLYLPEPVGVVAALALALALLQGYLLGGPRPRRRQALLRLRPLPRPTIPWTAAAVPVLLFTTWALGEVYTRLVPVPPESFDPFGGMTDTPLGRLSLAVLAVGVAPVLEEFFFRGLIQRTLERRWGAAAGIGGAAALFALVHFLPWVLPLHLFLGLVFGFAVYATRSIWAGVVLHAANNAAAMLGMGLQDDDVALPPTVWETGPDREWWLLVGTLLIALLLLARTGRGLWEAGKRARLRYGAADG